MLHAFTKNYSDSSTEAGFEFTFMCDNCGDGFKSSFIESETYKKKKRTGILGKTAGLAGGLLGGKASRAGYAAERGSHISNDRFVGQSPEWHKEHEQAFEKTQNESKQHFHRCPHCNKYVCDHCWNEDAGLCTGCAPRQEVYVAAASAGAMKRNIDEKAATAKVWDGKIESKVTLCQTCGKPAGTGKFCSNCGASNDMKECPKCGTKNAPSVRFCNNCGNNMQGGGAPAATPGKCPTCGQVNEPGTKFCGGCGGRM